MTRIKLILTALMFLAAMPVQAQWRCGRGGGELLDDSVTFSKWEPHLFVETGFMANNYGDNRAFTTVAPTLTYHVNDRLSFMGGFGITSDFGLNAHYNANNRSYAPYKQRNGGTGIIAAQFAAEYQVSENVWLAASISHIEGAYAPFYGPMNGGAFDVSATAISAAAAFRFNNDKYLHLSFTFIRDHAGTLPYMYHDAWMHNFGPWDGYFANSTDYYRMFSPMNMGYCNPWFND